MRTFDFERVAGDLLTPEIVRMIAEIHEHKGRQNLFLETHADEVKSLIAAAKIQSTGASNRIEGIYTSEHRLESLVLEKTQPKNRSEEEIAGYRDVLATIHEDHDYISVRPNIILQLHRDLYGYSGFGRGGSFKNADNIIAETDSQGRQTTRFVPVSAWETPAAMQSLCDAMNEAWNKGVIDKLLLLPIFVLDFLCIHPFNDGNGRMSRLLTLLLMYRAGFVVGKYISLELLIEKTKETYYEVLQASSAGWHEAKNSYEPFVRYYLGLTLKAYREFEQRASFVSRSGVSKTQRVLEVIENNLGRITKKEIEAQCPDISRTTIERALAGFVKEGKVVKVGEGKKTGYARRP